MCFHFHGDLDIKNGQIAHINKRNNDNSLDNLVYLCFDHHDNYDSRRSQSKGITSLELIHAKNSLQGNLSRNKKTESIKITISVEGDFHKLTSNEREQVLSKILSSAQINSAPEILNIESGSIKFTIEIDANEALQLLSSFNNNQLSGNKIIDMAIAEKTRKEDIHFSVDFKELRNGITKSVTRDIVQYPDSEFNLYDEKNLSPDGIPVRLCLKKLSYNHSAIVIVVVHDNNNLTIVCTLPFSHREITYRRGTNPMEVLYKFVNKYGLALTFEDKTKLIYKNEKIHTPGHSIIKKKMLLNYIIKKIKKCSLGKYLLIGMVRRNKIISQYVHIELMFVLLKTKYYKSLRKIGVKPKSKVSYGLLGTKSDSDNIYLPKI